MSRQPRFRTGDPALDKRVAELVQASDAGEDSDLIAEMIVSAVRMARERTNRGDLKVASSALKEMRNTFSVFSPYRSEKKLTIFGSARVAPADPLYDLTRRLATAFAALDWMVITGAGPGIMTAGIEGAGPENSFGVGIRLPWEPDTTELLANDSKLINYRYFFTRKLAFIKESDGFALLPGGFGTLDEAFELLTLTQTGKAQPGPIVMLDVPGGTFWRKWNDFVLTELLDQSYISEADLSLFKVTDSVEDAVDEIVGFYSNYHSLRFVSGKLVLRLKHGVTAEQLGMLNSEFADIVVSGTITEIDATADERRDDDVPTLPRISFLFDRHHWNRLRIMIDILNAPHRDQKP